MANTEPELRNFNHPRELMSSPRCILATPSDSDFLPFCARKFKVKGTAGDVKAKTLFGDEITIPMLSGEEETINITKIFATGTTATDVWIYM